VTALDYILNGLEAELQLERELGVRFVECDRIVLEPVVPETQPPAEVKASEPAGARALAPEIPDKAPLPSPARAAGIVAEAAPRGTGMRFDFVFLHEKPLSPKGAEMISKITAALKTTAELAPVVDSSPLPEARIYVVLGSLALRKWFPEIKAAPGMWVKTRGGSDVLVTYSPEYILRFGTVTPAVEKIKKDMWVSLKAVAQRAAQIR
jgi:hypothetical protein